jgi:hypothetical protein
MYQLPVRRGAEIEAPPLSEQDACWTTFSDIVPSTGERFEECRGVDKTGIDVEAILVTYLQIRIVAQSWRLPLGGVILRV